MSPAGYILIAREIHGVTRNMYYAVWLRAGVYTVRVFDFSGTISRWRIKSSLPLTVSNVNANLERRSEWNTAYTGFRMYRVDHHRERTMQISLQEAFPPSPTAALCPVFSLNNRPLDDFVAPQIANIVRTCANPNQRHWGCSSVNVTSRVSPSLSMQPSKIILIRYSCLERDLFLRFLFQSSLRFNSPWIVKSGSYNTRGTNYSGYISE